MEAYTGFAQVYDLFMDNIPYDEWAKYLISLLKEHHIKKKMRIADLGCGTGTITQYLYEAGYECIGIDYAEDMLAIAAEKMYDRGSQIIYSQQDMRDFGMPYPMDAMVSICDSMNYMTDINDLKAVFECVAEGLKDQGIFIFDLKTIHFFKDILGDNTFAENRDHAAFIWENAYDSEARNNAYELALFVENEQGKFKRFEEEHYQHAFYHEEVVKAAESAGLKFINVYDAFTKEMPRDKSERLYYIFEK